jgi:branched-chain amino acid aminotransferase
MVLNGRLFHIAEKRPIDEFLRITADLIRANKPTTDLYIRPTLYKALGSITPKLEGCATEFCMWVQPMGAYLDLNKGLDVCISNWRRVDANAIPPRAKVGGSYVNTSLTVTDAHRLGFDDAVVLTENGNVSEGSAMNIFLVRHGKLLTPPVYENILEGITRDTIMELAKNELGLETQQRTLSRSDLYEADEAFFCGTGAQVAAIGSFDRRELGLPAPGPITKKIQALYFEAVKAKLPRYESWCTIVPVE